MNAQDALLDHEVNNPLIEVSSFVENDKAVVTISDNAGGVPEEILDRIFEPYFTTKEVDKGTGIGLFMSKTIIEQNMKGSLSVRNKNGGAEFRIEV
jgi:C4-dicarboxylate-specific signal transduction histidine kinase